MITETDEAQKTDKTTIHDGSLNSKYYIVISSNLTSLFSPEANFPLKFLPKKKGGIFPKFSKKKVDYIANLAQMFANICYF